MIVVNENHNEEYAVREIVNSYYPKLKLIFEDRIPENDNYIFSSYKKDNNTHTFNAIVYINNIKEQYTVTESEYSKTYLKKAISRCLEKITGIHLPWGLLTGIRPSKIVREHIDSQGESENDEKLLNLLYEADVSKSRLAYTVSQNERKIIKKMPDNSVSLYIGIPFCPTRCLYCSFTSQSIDYSNKLTVPYVEALKKEIYEVGTMNNVRNKVIDTVYFGGGTPSSLSATQIDDIINTLKENFDLSKTREITFEAGRPDTITEGKLQILRKHGITRISINPQTTNNETLKIIGRKHSIEQFYESFNLARKLGFSHINCDIIAGLPGETPEDFKETLKNLENLNPESITVHTMSIKHGSYLDIKYDMYSLTTANAVNDMLKFAEQSMKKANKIPYYMYRQKNMLGNLENVGYCSAGHECLYNIYIMEEIQSIISLGAGASTKIINGNNIERVFNVKEVSEYIKRIDEMIDRKRKLLN